MKSTGYTYLPDHLDLATQKHLVEQVREIAKAAPLYRPEMPRTGQPFSVRMTNAGSLGWMSDRTGGYRYAPVHPHTAKPWPAIPESLLQLWDDITHYPAAPECCLINFYDETAKMGLHQDTDEDDKKAPVVSISLGDEARFRIGGETRKGSTTSFKVRSGDVVVLKGRSRFAFHGIDRIYPGTSMLLEGPGRINITLRRVTLPIK